MNVRSASRVPSWFAMRATLCLVALGLCLGLWQLHWPLVELCVAVLTMTGGAKLWSHLSLARAHVTLRVDRSRLFADETFELHIEAQNAKLLPVWLETSVPLPAALAGVRSGPSVRADAGLGAYQRVTFRAPIRALRRGVHVLGPSVIATADPLGFFRRSKAGSACEVVVYPRIIAIQVPVLPRRDFFERPDGYSPIEDPTYVQGVRDYEAGRPARHIHWSASARQQRLIEKVYEPTQREHVLLVLRIAGFETPSADAALETCLQVVASLALQLTQQRMPMGFVTDATVRGAASFLPPSRRPDQLPHLFEALARLQPESESDLSAQMHMAHALTVTTTVVLFSYQIASEDDALLMLLRRRKVPVVSILCDPANAGTAPATRSYRLRDMVAAREGA